ncbi:MAG TPA: sensor domain-containing protein, partial [Nocardioidaceae bacterium]|nr:sensor domain-containing protein [Nocardioidaceae bacterium]
MNARRAAAAVLLPLLLSACGSDQGVALSADEANQALLTADDVGEGFKVGELDQKAFVTQAGKKAGKKRPEMGCLDDLLVRLQEPHNVTADAVAEFVTKDPKTPLVSVASAVTVFAEESAASEFVTSFEKQATKCTKTRGDMPEGLTFKATVTTEAGDVPDSVDAQLRIGADATIGIPRLEIPLRISLSFVRVGRVVMTYSYNALSPTETYETELF